jgi:transposase, IS30 family
MKKKENLTLSERLEIKILLNKGYSMRAISRVLGRGHNTVSYEIKINMVNGEYDPKKANHKAYVRKKYSRFEWKKINENAEIKAFIIDCLKKTWNPDEIAGYMKKNKMPFYASKTAIYEWLYSTQGVPYCQYLYSKRYTKKPRKEKKTKRTLIPNRLDISKRFKGADNRSRYGHWEKDAVVSRQGISASLATAQERKTRLLTCRKVRNMSPLDHEIATQKMLRNKKSLSITRDNGIENIYHEQNPIPSFFCKPYSSWQKGSIENANKMIRRFFPKGTDFRFVSQNEVDEAINLINKKPRRILDFQSALELATKAGIIESIKSGVS